MFLIAKLNLISGMLIGAAAVFDVELLRFGRRKDDQRFGCRLQPFRRDIGRNAEQIAADWGDILRIRAGRMRQETNLAVSRTGRILFEVRSEQSIAVGHRHTSAGERTDALVPGHRQDIWRRILQQRHQVFGSIEGTILDEDSDGNQVTVLEPTSVTLYTGTHVAMTLSDTSDGMYRFENIPAGDFTLSARDEVFGRRAFGAGRRRDVRPARDRAPRATAGCWCTRARSRVRPLPTPLFPPRPSRGMRSLSQSCF